MISIVVMFYVEWCVRKPNLLLSCSIIALALNITIILIIILASFYISTSTNLHLQYRYNASNAAQTQTAYISSMYANTISSSSSSSSSTESNLAYTDADAGVGLECGFDSMDVQMIFAEDLFAAEDFVGTSTFYVFFFPSPHGYLLTPFSNPHVPLHPYTYASTGREPLFPSKEYFEDMGYDDQNDLDWD